MPCVRYYPTGVGHVCQFAQSPRRDAHVLFGRRHAHAATPTTHNNPAQQETHTSPLVLSTVLTPTRVRFARLHRITSPSRPHCHTPSSIFNHRHQLHQLRPRQSRRIPSALPPHPQHVHNLHAIALPYCLVPTLALPHTLSHPRLIQADVSQQHRTNAHPHRSTHATTARLPPQAPFDGSATKTRLTRPNRISLKRNPIGTFSHPPHHTTSS